MPDLTDVVVERISDFSPAATPPFGVLQHRYATCRRRRRALTCAAALLLVTSAAAGTQLLALDPQRANGRLTTETITPVALPGDADAAAAALADLLIADVQDHARGEISDRDSSSATTIRADGPLLALQATLRWKDEEGMIRIAATWTPRLPDSAPTDCEAIALTWAHDCRTAIGPDGGVTVLYSQDMPQDTRTAVHVFPDGSHVLLFLAANQPEGSPGRGASTLPPRADRPTLPFTDSDLVDIVSRLAVSTTAAPRPDPDLALHQCMAAHGATATYTALGWDASFPSATKTAEVKAQCREQLTHGR